MVKAIFEHKSIRKFKSDPISDEIINKILEAATRASNTGNMQVYSIVATKDQKIKEELLPLHFNQQMVKVAPLVLTFCADINRFNKWCKLRNANPGYNNMLWFVNATIDAMLAAQNACIEAEDKGLGICYLGTTTYMADKIIKVLDLPKGVVPVTTVVVGYPDENPELTDRLPVEAVVHNEKYHDYSNDDINKLYEAKEARADSKQFIAVNKLETLAQVFTNVRYKTADNIHFSKEFIKVLKTQGFLEE
jgi:nitroreductase